MRILDLQNPVNMQDPLMRGCMFRTFAHPNWSGNQALNFATRRNHLALINGVKRFNSKGDNGRFGSLNFSSGSSQYATVSSAAVTGVPFTLAGWFYTTDYSVGRVICSVTNSADDQPLIIMYGGNGFASPANIVLMQYRNNAGTGMAVPTTATFTLNTWNFATFVGRATNDWSVYLNGRNRVNDSTNCAGPVTFNTTSIGAYNRPTIGGYYEGFLDNVMMWNRALSDDEIWTLYQNTQQKYKSALNYIYIDEYDLAPAAAAGGNVYSLAIGSGSFAYTGTAVGLKADRKLAIASGSYPLTGTAVGLKKGSSLPIGSGSFPLIGTDVSLKASRILPVDSGSFPFTGTAVSLKSGRTLSIGSGSFPLTGTAVTLKATRTLAIGAGSFPFTGQDVTLTYSGSGSKVLAIDAGSFAFTGAAVGLRAARTLTIASGAFPFTGSAVSLRFGHSLVISSGSFAFTGQAVSLYATRSLPIGVGSFPFTGSPVGLRRGYTITVSSGAFAFTGSAVTLVAARRLAIDAANYPFTGYSVALVYSAAPDLSYLRLSMEMTQLFAYNITGQIYTMNLYGQLE